MAGRHIISGSRGKGSRRVPWRDGGRRKQRPVLRRKQAIHAVEDRAELGEPLASFHLGGRYGEKPAHLSYRLDQAMAHARIRYYAEYCRECRGFIFVVPGQCRERVLDLLARLRAGGRASMVRRCRHC